MYSCTLYGLSVDSAIPISSTSTDAVATVDVTVRYGPINSLPSPSEITAAGPHYRVTPRRIFLFWDGIGTFLVRDGREITIDAAAGVHERALRKAILGDVFAALLHQRGLFTLHASAVAIDKQVVVFLGKSGSGKSTVALALHDHGNELVADDVVAINVGGITPVAPPAYPQISIWPDTLTAFSLVSAELCGLAPSAKRVVPVRQRFARATLPVSHFFVLDPTAGGSPQTLSRQEALAALLDNSYCFKLLNEEEIVAHLTSCARIVAGTATMRVGPCRSLELLPLLAQQIEEAVRT